jgi:hypothetical protein
MSENEATAVVADAEVKPATVAKVKATGDLIHDTASDIENLTKVKALNEAAKLSENIEQGYFRLGGVLKVIFDNAWFEGYETFGQFVFEKFGFMERKARYLMKIYENLVNKQIPWEKVSSLGWTKLKDLAEILTPENVDEWVEKASKLTVAELQAVLKGAAASSSKASTTTTDEVSVIKFKLHNDQLDTITSALNKAKGEVGTEHDTVALETICSGYLAGTVGAATSIDQWFDSLGWEATLEKFCEKFPQVDLQVTVNDAAKAG